MGQACLWWYCHRQHQWNCCSSGSMRW